MKRSLLVIAISFAFFSKPLLAEETKPLETKAAVTKKEPVETYMLRYKLKPGEILRYKVAHAARVSSTMKDNREDAEDKNSTLTVKTRSDSVKAWKILDRFPNGDIQFSHVVESIKLHNEMPDKAPMDYDSTKDKMPPHGFEQAAAAVGVTLTIFRVSPTGKIVSRKDMPVMKANQSVQDDVPMVIPVPKKAIAIRDTWDEPHHLSVQLKNGDMKSIKTRRHFKLTSVKNGIATIKVSYQVLSPMDARMESQLVQKLSKGTIKFDIQAGRVAALQLDVDRRIIGFAGPSSGMQFRSRFTEQLIKKTPEVAKKKTEVKK